MTIPSIDESQRKAARVAGFAYLLSLATEVVSEFRIKPPLIVAGNAAETARNILAHESLFRLGIAFDLIYAVGTVALLTALYVILKPVNRNLALLATFWRLVYAVMWVVIALNSFMVRDLYFRFHHLARLFQGRQPVVVRYADGYFRDRDEFLASVQGIGVI